MIKKVIIIITGLFLLSGCADGFKGYFKKSANNKWLDTKGFHGGKRKPLYNRKYINMAKRNVVEENFDDDDEELDFDDNFEGPNTARMNREMYMEMIKQDNMRKKRRRLEQHKSAFGRNSRSHDYDDYPTLSDANTRINSAHGNDQDLQKELSEIKSMLSEAKRDLTKYKCPMEQQQPKSLTPSQPSARKSINKAKVAPKKNDAGVNEKFIEEEDDYKQTNSMDEVKTNLYPHSI